MNTNREEGTGNRSSRSKHDRERRGSARLLVQRIIHGTYVSVEPFHLFRYLDEQAFRFNNRRMSDADRFAEVLKGIVGKRVMYTELTAALAGNSPV